MLGYDTVSVMGGVVAFGLTPFTALRVKVQLPTADGTPPKDPLGVMTRPGGNEPELTENDGAGMPVARK